jgi:hypothetical protein
VPARKNASVTIPPPLLAEAENLAKQKRKSVRAVVCSAIERYLAEEGARPRKGKRTAEKRASRTVSASRAHAGKDLWETITGPFQDLPKSVLRRLPRDGSVNHDRYIYGWP